MRGAFICVLCPTSCPVQAEWNEAEVLSLEGAQCKLAWEHIRGEIFDPRRTVTTTVLVEGGDFSLVSVKTDAPVPKGMVMEVMDYLADLVAQAPLEIGQVIVPDILGIGSNIVATRRIRRSDVSQRRRLSEEQAR